MEVKTPTLPPGIWQELLPKALTLVDEISKHGGVADPFFTFGGGTVLMLRYQHRFSKDIDIFVPDPQSLGFISPRLSDIAEDLCDGQYTEAANFVKLILDAGEIDFVAAPNLLPEECAFEQWMLFDRPVRVETAAEIVAKKMFHRGAQATARDLFDLAMVVEREETALRDAEPFMYRHLAQFTSHLMQASAGLKAQFDAIQKIDYSPTFDVAVQVALDYAEGLIRHKTSSFDEAARYASEAGLSVVIPTFSNAEYSGEIIHQTTFHAVQSAKGKTAVVHDLHAFRPVAKPIPPGMTTVKYHGDKANIKATASR